MKYRVDHLQNSTYQVVYDGEHDIASIGAYMMPIVFQGSLSDCEAYIRLKQNENVEF